MFSGYDIDRILPQLLQAYMLLILSTILLLVIPGVAFYRTGW